MFILLDFILTLVLTLFFASILTPLPLSDTGNVRYRTVPIVTILLIIANALVFMIFQGPNYYQGQALYAADNLADHLQGVTLLNNYIAQTWTFGYRAIFVRQQLGIGAFSVFTSMFMHADFFHLLFNMIYLWAFGRRVEDACGSWRFLAYYLISGVVATIGWELFNTAHVDEPIIGASGAIAGIMGAYLVMFPGAMITCIWGLGTIFRVPVVVILKWTRTEWIQSAPAWRWTIKLPAFLLLLFFLGQESLASLLPFLKSQQSNIDGVAHAAHVSGFLAALLIFLFVRKDLLTRYFSGRRL